MANPGLIISACEVLDPATLLPIPQGLSPLSLLPRNLGPLDKTPRGIVRRTLTNPEEIWYTDGSNFVLDGKRRARYAVISNFETIKAKPLPPVKVPGYHSWIHCLQVKPWKKMRGHSIHCQQATICSASSTRT